MEVAWLHCRVAGMLVAAWAMVICVPASAGPAPAPAKPGQFYTSFGWGAYRGDSAGFVYGRNATNTGPAYDYHPPVTGVSAGLDLGYVLSEAVRWPAWLGENLRIELAHGYADASGSASGFSPTNTRLPFLDNRTPNLHVTSSPIPDDQDSFSQELNDKSYDLKLATDYRLPRWSLTVTPFLGVSRITRQETSRLTLIDPNSGKTDMTLSERLDSDYSGVRAGATIVAPLGSGWRAMLGASRSWLRADAGLHAEQAFPNYPAPPGTMMQLDGTANGNSARRQTYLLGIGHDSGWARVYLIVERTSWSYIPTVVNPGLFTDPVAHLDAGHAADTAFRAMFTVPFGH